MSIEISQELASILNQLQAKNPSIYSQVNTAIASSEKLLDALNDAAISGELVGIDVDNSKNIVFSPDSKEFIFGTNFVYGSGDVNSLTIFILGHELEHAKNSASDSAQRAVSI